MSKVFILKVAIVGALTSVGTLLVKDLPAAHQLGTALLTAASGLIGWWGLSRPGDVPLSALSIDELQRLAKK